MKRIHDSLQQVFLRNRLVFWYDADGEWIEEFESFSNENIKKLKVANNEFTIKVGIIREPETRFLVYVPTQRPPDAENWLLDLLLQGYQYKADKASLALQEAGLPYEFLHVAEEHAAYFNSGKRTQALKEMFTKEDNAHHLQLKMMSVLAGTAVEVDAILLEFLEAPEQGDLFDSEDPVAVCFGAAALTEAFWRETKKLFGYSSETPSLRDFAVTLFRSANPLDSQAKRHSHAIVFLQRWKDSQSYRASFQKWSSKMEKVLQIETSLNGLNSGNSLELNDTFEIFEKFLLHRLCTSFDKGAPAADLRLVLQNRRTSFWYGLHENGYASLEHAVELRELLAAAELSMDSMPAGITRYTASWWRIDMAYRRCCMHLRRYGQVQVMEPIGQWIENAYVNNFLLTLADRWSDLVRAIEKWNCVGTLSQRDFFETYVQPFRTKGQKVFVIVSDALRYEAAADFAQRLSLTNRWKAEVDVMLGSLPSYTQLGMASLLPGKKWSVDATAATVSLDGRSASGTDNRAEILRAHCDGKATAIQHESFLEMNSKTDGRALMRDNEVIYIFHNKIDKVGDVASTEVGTFDAVEQAFAELEQIIKKIANINGSNMILTSDHGFLFQQTDILESDMVALPKAEKLTHRARRFVLGKNIVPGTTTKTFDSAAMDLEGNWQAAFPLSLGRFPLQGSGKRYVHGGISLQEVVVPVVKIHKARTDDIERIEVDFMGAPAKITTGSLSLSLFQDRPAVEKVLPRTLRIGVFANDNTALSELKTIVFDSKDEDARNRETRIILVLSHTSNEFNNREVEVRLEETVPGTSQIVTYKTHTLKLQKPFASDFDD